MAYADTLPKQRGFGETTRTDTWWLQPLVVLLGFSAFIIYSTWAAFQGVADLHNHMCHYWYGGLHGENGGANYLSPFYSPEFWGNSPHSLGQLPGWWPSWAPFSPAFLILWVPAGFRFTCYYYRGAYYKGFWADPINCAVGEPRATYLGERFFPLIIQNGHRYFLYLAILFIFLLSYDAWLGLWFTDSTGAAHFGVGVGTIVLSLNAEAPTILRHRRLGYALQFHDFRLADSGPAFIAWLRANFETVRRSMRLLVPRQGPPRCRFD